MQILFPILVLFLASAVENTGCPCTEGACTCKGECVCPRCNTQEKMGLLPPGTSTQARMNQSFQAGLLSQPGSMSNRFAIDSGAHDAYTLRLQGKDPGEKGFALIRASRGGSLGSGWGEYWPYDRLEADNEMSMDDIAEQVASSYGAEMAPTDQQQRLVDDLFREVFKENPKDPPSYIELWPDGSIHIIWGGCVVQGGRMWPHSWMGHKVETHQEGIVSWRGSPVSRAKPTPIATAEANGTVYFGRDKSRSTETFIEVPSSTDEVVKEVFKEALSWMKTFNVDEGMISVSGDGNGLRISTAAPSIIKVKTALKNAGAKKDVKLMERWPPPEAIGGWSVWLGRTSDSPSSTEAFGRHGGGGGRHHGGGGRHGGHARHGGGGRAWRGGGRYWRGGPWGWSWWPYGPLYTTPVIINEEPLASDAAANAFAVWAQGETGERVDVDDDGTVRVSFDGSGSFERWRRRMASMASQMAGRYSAIPEMKSTVMGFAVRFLAR